jgi:hypothetical protein
MMAESAPQSATLEQLILRRANLSRPSGSWAETDYVCDFRDVFRNAMTSVEKRQHAICFFRWQDRIRDLLASPLEYL